MFGIGRHLCGSVGRWSRRPAVTRRAAIGCQCHPSIPAMERPGCLQGSTVQEDITTPLQLQITALDCHSCYFLTADRSTGASILGPQIPS
jgi:hypothetical protein